MRSNGQISGIGTENASTVEYSILVTALKGFKKGLEKVPIDGKDKERERERESFGGADEDIKLRLVILGILTVASHFPNCIN